MPFHAERYPADWSLISLRVRERDGNRCKWCLVENHALGGRTADGRFWSALPLGNGHGGMQWPMPGLHAYCEDDHYLRIIRVVLTVAHLDHDPTNCADDNLAALCQRCHLRYDAALHRRNSEATRRARRALGDLFA